MTTDNRFLRLTLPFAVGVAFLGVVGCGADDGLGKRYYVGGKVSYKGAPVEKGSVSFVSDKEGRGATGSIENGTYSLSTLSEGDGVLPGVYKVTVDTRVIDDAAAKAAAKKFAEKMGFKGEVTQIPEEVRSKMMKEAKSTTPAKYLRSDTSDLTVTVEAKSNTIDIDLKD